MKGTRQRDPARLVWSYWSGPRDDVVFAWCQASWRRHLPNSTIRVLSPVTLGAFVNVTKRWPRFASYPPSLQSDLARLAILARRGGVYMDATVFLFRDLDWVFEGARGAQTPVAFQTSRAGEALPYVQSWFLHAPRARTPLFERWSAELDHVFATSFPALEHHAAYSPSCTSDASVPGVAPPVRRFAIYQVRPSLTKPLRGGRGLRTDSALTLL